MQRTDATNAVPRNARGCSRAFTLVELSAVATAVIAAVAVLLSTIGATRQQDRLAGCLANLRAIGAASLAYAAADPNELLIALPDLSVLPAQVGDFEWGGKAGRGQSSMPGQITASYWGTAAFKGPGHRPLNAVLYKGEIANWNPINDTPQPGPGGSNYINDANLDLDVYRCPADTGYAGGGFLYTGSLDPQRDERPFRNEGFTAYDHYGTSYVAPSLFIYGGISGSPIRSMSMIFKSLSSAPDPGRTVAFEEVPARRVWMWGSWAGSGCPGYDDRVEGHASIVPGWHERDFGFNLTYADGHAATVEMRGCTRPAPNLGLANYPPNECGAGVSGYQCWRCVTVRGPAWQIDTLPSPAAPTPWFFGRTVSLSSAEPSIWEVQR